MRLIDAHECTSVETMKAFPVFEESGANVEDLKELIASCKTVDAVVPVVHGEWVDKTKYTFKCSVCSCRSFGYDFCPHCGAKMDLNK